MKKAAPAAGKTGFSISAPEPSRSRRAVLGPDNEKGALWTAGKADGEGKIVIRLDPGLEIADAVGRSPGMPHSISGRGRAATPAPTFMSPG